MTKGRDNLAETFTDLLDLVRARRQTGLLSIERLYEGRYEEGGVYVQGGQVVYAHTGQLTGLDALARLQKWHHIYFAFLPDAGHPTANISSAADVTATSVRTHTAPSFPALNSNRNGPSRVSGTGGLQNRPQPALPAQNASQVEPSTPGLEWLTPRKVGGERDVMTLPLTRPQRSIYLLIDGRRTVADLSRCTRKSMQEIERLLSELQEHGLITI